MYPVYVAANGTNVIQVTRVAPLILNQDMLVHGNGIYGRVPTADHWIADHLIFVNGSATPGTITVWHFSAPGEGKQNYNLMFSNLVISAHETKIFNLILPMSPDTRFYGTLVSDLSAAVINFHILGVKITD